MKNNRGFTLIEMILTIALIMVLTTVFTASLTTYISKSRDSSVLVEEHLNKYDAAKASVAALRGNGGAATPTAAPGSFLVTFADWDGTVLKTQSVISGGAAAAPGNPTRAGYAFSGWNPSTFSNITSDLAVTAEYTITSNTVNFVDWNGTVLKTETVDYGGSVTAPADPARTGYTFTGWDPSDFSNITISQTITAQYSIVSNTVTFTDWDGTILKEDTVAYGGTATAPANPTRIGYTFIGWNPYDFSNITGAQTVTALYSILTNIVNFVDWNGTVLKQDTVNYGGTATAPPNPTRAGYVFSGWSPSVYSNITAPLTVTAQYKAPITGVSISGTARFGSVLTASVAPSGATVSYQWSSASTAGGAYSAISGATGNTYTLVLADLAKYIKVTVVGTGSFTGTATSGSAGAVTTCPLSGVTVNQFVKNKVSTATVSPAGATCTYQWWKKTTATGAWVIVTGQTAKTYNLPNTGGIYYRVVVVGTGGYSGTFTSNEGKT